jgi:hypothetical protein
VHAVGQQQFEHLHKIKITYDLTGNPSYLKKKDIWELDPLDQTSCFVARHLLFICCDEGMSSEHCLLCTPNARQSIKNNETCLLLFLYFCVAAE